MTQLVVDIKRSNALCILQTQGKSSERRMESNQFSFSAAAYRNSINLALLRLSPNIE